MTLPTWDLVITLFFLMVMAYGFILGRGRIVIILILTYAAALVAGEAGSLVYNFFTGTKQIADTVWISSNMSLFSVKVILFALIIILMSTRGELGSLSNLAKGVRSTFLVGFYSFFNAGLIISSIIRFLPEGTQQDLLNLSPIATKVNSYRIWWLLLPIIVMIVEGFLRGRQEATKE
jgi:hypothetical protein